MRIRRPDIIKHQIENLYLSDGKSSIEIASILGCAKSTVLRKMKNFNINRRTVGEALSGKVMPDDVRKKISVKAKERQQGSAHSSWKGGRIKTSSGHVLIWKKDHPFAGVKGYVLEHRLIVETKIGRYLRPEEQIHHINGIPDDNRPENLMLCANFMEHCKAHGGGLRTGKGIKLL